MCIRDRYHTHRINSYRAKNKLLKWKVPIIIVEKLYLWTFWRYRSSPHLAISKAIVVLRYTKYAILRKETRKFLRNYRGITVLPIMSKIFTAIIRDRLLYWADLNDKLNESQFGFRQGPLMQYLSCQLQSRHIRRRNLHFKHALSTMPRLSTLLTTTFCGTNLHPWA